MAYARTLTKVYAQAYDQPRYLLDGEPNAARYVAIPAGSVGEIVSQIRQPTTGILITTILFGDLLADLGSTVWEFVEDE